jgi:hypothetical protein
MTNLRRLRRYLRILLIIWTPIMLLHWLLMVGVWYAGELSLVSMLVNILRDSALWCLLLLLGPRSRKSKARPIQVHI